MNVDTGKMTEYADFLDETSRKIVALCSKIEESLIIAVQCMDQQSGRGAAQRMAQNLENIKNNVPNNKLARPSSTHTPNVLTQNSAKFPICCTISHTSLVLMLSCKTSVNS